MAKINYHIYTNAIKNHLIPTEVTKEETATIYATQADMLNMALWGITAKQWRKSNKEFKENLRDYASINQLICLSNMNNINAVLINEGMAQSVRLVKLNQIAIQQMSVLSEVGNKRVFHLK